MQINDSTPLVDRTIADLSVKVPAPYAAGPHELTEGEANALNQTIAENISNNLRKKLNDGVTEGEGENATTRPYTDEEAQKLVDEYVADYEVGVRRSGSGEARVTDPVEREARKIARQKAVELVKQQGGKPSDFDMQPIVDAIFEANKDLLMAEGKKIVKALEKAKEQSAGLNVEGISLPTAAPAEAAEAA